MASSVEQAIGELSWQPHPDAAALIDELLKTFCQRSRDIARFGETLRQQTGTRLIDWTDHFAIPVSARPEDRLEKSGFAAEQRGRHVVWAHPGGLFPQVVVHDLPAWRLAIKVESVADFLAAQGLQDDVRIEGRPMGRVRRARIGTTSGTEFWALQRHGHRGWEPPEPSTKQIAAALAHQEAFWRRRRRFAYDEDGFAHAVNLARHAVNDLGAGWASDLFFAAERQYWTSRNRAARLQKARQDALGLGWGNHDHHTYRSSREHFNRLIALLETLGMVCRERFYAGSEAGWGAQVLEQEQSQVVAFADVDLAPEEVAGDFAHQPLRPRAQLGTVGLWCLLHGEACLQPGLHHLECRFDFDAARSQLRQAGIAVMRPFTDLPFLKQAFTAGELWPVDPGRLEAALAAGAVSSDRAAEFRQSGAIGSHLEILQRDEGYKGFNQSGINDIIRATDPRRAAGAEHDSLRAGA